MIEFLLIILILVAGAIYALKKKQKRKCLIYSGLAAASFLFSVYLNYLMEL